MEETPQGSNNAGVVIGWIEKLSGLIKNVGLQNIITTIMLLFLVIIVGQTAFNPIGFVKKIQDIEAQQHTESVIKRIKAEPQIRELLVDLRGELNADRVYILETHNGGNNLANLPFLYVDLTYAEPKNVLTWMENEYKNVRLSRYPWATHLFDETYYCGDVEKMKDIDPELYYRLKNEDVKYMSSVMIYGKYNPSGVLGVVYTTDNIPSENSIRRTLTKYASSLSILLNNE